jgi:Protein of unknown function (DUF1588)/Protein of unknown function (DUF1592)/Protein of unknown function (DUF1595)/Protein of unknown function (DUF1585)/Protein of unknown function (DUF1587)
LLCAYWLATLAGLATACEPGVVVPSSAPISPTPSAPPENLIPTPFTPAPSNRAHTVTRLRRLGNPEIENVISDLLGARQKLTNAFLEDPKLSGYDNDVAALVVSETKLEELGVLAAQIADLLVTPARLHEIAPCDAGTARDACARNFITAAAQKLWGRRATDSESARLLALYATGSGASAHAEGIAQLVEAMLLSPHFIYRTELGEGAANAAGDVKLTGAETASAISFLATGARPDAQLLSAGLSGALDDPEVRSGEAQRLLGSAAGRRQMERFVRLWLGLDDVAVINKDLGVYPQFTPAVRQALDRELARFLDHVFADEAGRLDHLLGAAYSFPGPALAAIYGPDELLDPIGDFTRVRLDGKRRRGLLGGPAFLARHALISATNPVERGLVIRNRIFCQDVAPPPPEIAATPPPASDGTTTRSKYEAHVREPFCRACHQLMDPLGFGLEGFDPLGRIRSHEGKIPVDPRGEVVGTDVDGPFAGPAELAERLTKSAQVGRCLVQQFWRFAHGREVTDDDRAEIDHLAWRFAEGGRSLTKLALDVVARPNFNLRHLDLAPPGAAP